MAFRKVFGVTSLVVLSGVVVSTTEKAAEAETPFGPISGRAFAWKPGTTIENIPPAKCTTNSDWLVIKGPNVASVKTIEISPKTQVWDKQITIPAANTCTANDQNCYQILVKVGKDDPGPRTVTLKHADGRTLTTTFDIVANAGRCDYGGGK